MKMIAVNSTNISHIGHDPERKKMRVCFGGSKTYEYPNVSAEEFENFNAAESKGGYFNANFRNRKFSRIIC